MKQTRPPMLICEPILTEAVYFLREDGVEVDPLFQLLQRGAIRLQFDMSAHWPRIRTLMARYQRELASRSGTEAAPPIGMKLALALERRREIGRASCRERV